VSWECKKELQSVGSNTEVTEEAAQRSQRGEHRLAKAFATRRRLTVLKGRNRLPATPGKAPKKFRRRKIFMRRYFFLVAAVCLSAAAASAQTKVSGTAQFGKPDTQQLVPVGDRPDHSLGVAQLKCTWTKPMEIGGDKFKEGVSTETAE